MDAWKLIYNDWKPEQEGLREALCTLGNGYFATRGAGEESKADGVHYPGTYLAGGYNRLQTELSGRMVENEDLVNWPNWLGLNFRAEGGEWFSLQSVEVLDYFQELNLHYGILERRVRFRDPRQRVFTLHSRRMVHMAHPHLAALEWTLVAENWSGRVEVRSAIDGTVANEGVERYKKLNTRHLVPLETGRSGEAGIYLLCQTNQSCLRMGLAARTLAFAGHAHAAVERNTREEPGWIGQDLELTLERNQPVRVEKIIALYTGRDHAISEPGLEARNTIERADSFPALLERHKLAWSHLWERCDIEVDGDDSTQCILRLHIFHLLQTVSLNSIPLDIGVPSRGWHGEAYRGHIFWDEIFIFPFLTLRIPDLTISLLLYRYRRMPEARFAARESGYQGTLYPWQSGSNGREESQLLHLNPRSGRWVPDNTHLQRHVNGAIAYNIWQYYQATGDTEFISFYGSEMIVEIARFWASLATYNSDRDRYEIRGVVGPDEFHTNYPDSEELGINNNAYTNILASWTLHRALEVLDLLSEDRRRRLLEDFGVTPEDLDRWDKISRKMFVPFHEDGIISQFEGYERLEDFDWKGYRKKYGDIQRLDRILEAEGDTPNRYKASKQADVLMLFFLFSREEIEQIFNRLEYPFDPQMIPENIKYYLQHTSHGSTLSRVVHSWVLSRADREGSWSLFEDALESDVADIQGGTTPEGVHLGAMVGTVDLVQRCFIGLEMREDILWFNPCLPEELKVIKFRIRYRGTWFQLNVAHEKMTITLERSKAPPVQVAVQGAVHTLSQGETREFQLK